MTLDYLGHILWFTIGDGPEGPIPVSRDQLEKQFLAAGLNPAVLPDPVRPVDAFRAASSGVERKYTVDKTEYSLKSIDVSSDKFAVVRHVVRTHRNTRSGRLVEHKAAELTFIRPVRTARGIKAGTEMWRYAINKTLAPVGTVHRQEIQDLIDLFSSRYVNHEKYVPTSALRKVVRDTLTDLSAVLLKPSGGVYFVPAENTHQALGLQEVVRGLGPSCVFHALPLVNDATQRAMVNDAFAEDVTRDGARLVTRAESLRPGVEPERFDELEQEMLDLMTRTEAHMARLPEMDLGGVADALEEAHARLAEILSNRRSHLPGKRQMNSQTRPSSV
jgi:hypothetical protein